MKHTKLILTATLLAVLPLGAAAQQPLHNDEAARAKQNMRSFPMNISNYTIKSDILGEERCFSVYVPASYGQDQSRKYPVAYLLHGAGENDRQWANIPQAMVNEAIAESINGGEAQEMVIVFPDATTTRMGYYNVEGWAYEDFFFKELVPYIEANFPVYTDKGHRAIGGLSMGGGGSVNYALRHPDMFSSVYAMSAAVGSVKVQAGSDATFSSAFQSSPDILASISEEEIEKVRTIKWTLDCGDDDFLLEANQAFYKAMREAKVPCQLRVRDGMHATYYWYRALTLALPYFSKNFDK